MNLEFGHCNTIFSNLKYFIVGALRNDYENIIKTFTKFTVYTIIGIIWDRIEKNKKR